MKPTHLLALALTGTTTTTMTALAAYPRFQKYSECVAYCDADATCQSAFFDTISGDCQYHDCIYGQLPPDRFRAYIKGSAADYCAGTSPTASPNWVDAARTATETGWVSMSVTATGTGTATAGSGTATGATAAASATGTSGTSGPGWGSAVARGEVVAGVVGGWVAVGLLG